MYAVVFASTLSADSAGYEAAAARMEELARAQPGFVSIDSVRDADGRGITVCCWESLEAVEAWRTHAEHLAAQRQGRERWYESYELTVCQVLES